MRQSPTNICVVLLIGALVLVSASCTSAGCLLPVILHQSGATCCCHDSGRLPGKPTDGGHCPLCQGSGMTAASAEQVQANHTVAMLCPALTCVPADLIMSRSHVAVGAAPSIVLLPTLDCAPLYAMHCALLI